MPSNVSPSGPVAGEAGFSLIASPPSRRSLGLFRVAVTASFYLSIPVKPGEEWLSSRHQHTSQQ